MSHCFEAIEGLYQLCRCSVSPYKNSTLNKVPVRLSFFDEYTTNKSPYNIPDRDVDSACNNIDYEFDGLYCYNIGKELYMHNRHSQNVPIDRRVFKARPTSHAFKYRDNLCKPYLAVGLANGEIHLLCHMKEMCKIFNDEKSIDETAVTCIAWVPDSPNQFIVGNLSGNLYIYDENICNSSNPPSYELFKESIGFTVYTCKAKSTRNPLYRWSFGADARVTAEILSNRQSGSLNQEQLRDFEFTPLRGGSAEQIAPKCSLYSQDGSSAINQFAFSPCGQYLAIVTQDGYLRVMDYHIMELYGFMRSYFAGLLCVDWSPDGRYIAVGGQDDLITIWSIAERSVICRGQGHRSWINRIRFDPHLCPSLQFATNTSTGSQTSEIPNGSGECNTVDPACANRNGDFDATINCNSEEITDHSTSSSTYSNTTPNNVIDGVPLGVIYRLGSVGQDTFFCLWDLTDDVIRDGIQFIRGFTRRRSTNACNPSSPNTDQHAGQTSCPTSSLTAIPTGKNPPPTSFLRHFNGSAHGENRSVTSSLGLLTFFSLNRHKSVPGSTVGYRDSKRGRRNRKRLTPESARGTSSTAWWNLANGSSDVIASSPSSSTLAQSSCREGLDVSDSFLGTPICPRIGDVPMLEPIVYNMMHQHRLTDLAFRRDSVNVICQQGMMRVWSRPVGRTSNDYPSGIMPSCRSPPLPSGFPTSTHSPQSSIRSPRESQRTTDPPPSVTASERASWGERVSLRNKLSTSWPPPSLGKNTEETPSATEGGSAGPGVSSTENSVNACNHHSQQPVVSNTNFASASQEPR